MLTPTITAIPVQEVLRYLGGPITDVPSSLLQSVQGAAAQLQAVARPRAVWRSFDLDGTALTGTTLTLPGDAIQRHLSHCHRALLMAATLGADAERLLLHTQVTDMAQALILDSSASAAIENVCDNLEADLRSQVESQGFFLTDRFSPGYGDLPLSLQSQFCTLLNTQRQIGLTVSQTSLLIPRKSVTAILGISDQPRLTRSSGCQNCALFETCQIRKGGATCQTP